MQQSLESGLEVRYLKNSDNRVLDNRGSTVQPIWVQLGIQ